MATLDGATFDAALALIRRLGECPDLDAFAVDVASGVHDLVGGISVSYNEINPAAGRAFAVIHPDPGVDWFTEQRPLFERHVHEHPTIDHITRTGAAAVWTWDDVCDVDAFRASALFREFYAPLGIQTQLVVNLPAPPDVVIGIAVNRGDEGFEPHDRGILALLQPHLSHAYHLAQLRTTTARLESAFDAGGWAPVLVDDAGTMVGEPSERLDGGAAGGGLAAAAPAIAAHVRAAVRASPSGRAAATTTAATIASPIGRLETILLPGAVPPHVLLVRSERRTMAARGHALGLTSRETDVLVEAADGATNREVAHALGLAESTVKKHLERAFVKLAVSTRGEALARLRDG